MNGERPTRNGSCEVAAGADRCPEKAEYEIGWRYETAWVCDRCIHSWVRLLTRQGDVSVRRLEDEVSADEAF